MSTDLNHTVAIVTGASAGIGFGIAEALLEAGCRVAICARSADKLKKAADRLEQFGTDVLAVPCDVASELQVQSLFAQVDATFGPVGILVNNAGAFDGGPVEDLSIDAWNNVIGSCLTGSFLCTREAFRRMKPQGKGRVLNIGSISAQRSRMNSAPYTAAKFGVQGLTHATALEGRSHGIAVSCLHPGNVMVERRENSGLVSDQEPMMAVDAIVQAAMTMLTMPQGVNFLDAVVLPNEQLYLGRG
ncbi:MAG: SDR family oxidoreductase [Planctomycetaceae bacterium]|nr:SDR family oxidoreductase [Planctomycetaceae bacterium]